MCCILVLLLCAGIGNDVAAEDTPPVFVRNDPAEYTEYEHYLGGAGAVEFMEMYGPGDFRTNLYFFRQGILPPKSSIGEHSMNNAEVMYVILDGAARVTVDGKTGVIPGGSMVLCQIGTAHGVYNHTDKDVPYLHIAAVADEGPYDVVPKNNNLSDAEPSYPVPFAWAHIDSRLTVPAPACHGGAGVIYGWGHYQPDSFATRWEGAGQNIIPPGASIGYHRHDTIEEVYYILYGTGRMTVDGETFDVEKGDCIPCFLHSSHGIYNNCHSDVSFFGLQMSVEKNRLDATDLGDDLTDK